MRKEKNGNFENGVLLGSLQEESKAKKRQRKKAKRRRDNEKNINMVASRLNYHSL